MIVNANPTMNPFITGSEMKFATNPNRSKPATSATTPVEIANVAVNVTNIPLLADTYVPTAAADNAAVADIGPAIRCLELPNAA
jgi:hypothetical protein